MTLDDLVPPSPFSSDSETHRTCGECLEQKPVAEFYKDGTDNEGNTKYRRNCKSCYTVSRLKAAAAKKQPAKPAPKPRGRKGAKRR